MHLQRNTYSTRDVIIPRKIVFTNSIPRKSRAVLFSNCLFLQILPEVLQVLKIFLVRVEICAFLPPVISQS